MTTTEQQIDKDDDDAPAIGPEQGSPDDAGDLDADPGAVEPGHGAHRRHRVIGESTRKLFAAAGAKLKEQLDNGDGDDLEPAIPAADQGAPAQPQGAAGATAATTTPQQPATPPPAPSLSPDARAAEDRARLAQEARDKAHADREAALVKREAALEARERAAERYIDKPAETIAELVKEWTGAETDDEVRDEIADLVTQLSAVSLGLKLPDELKLKSESRRALRTVKAFKAGEAKRGEADKKRAEADAARNRRHAAINALAERLPSMKEGDKHKFPWLMAEENPHEIVWEVIEQQWKDAGSPQGWQPDVAAAAKIADDYFKDTAGRYFDKRRHLLTPTPATAASPGGSAPQGDLQSRRSSALTNRTNAPAAPTPLPADGALTGDERRRRSLAKLRPQNGAGAT